ncbi:MAG: alkaline phosphatase family protein [Chitinophagia bacterium]|nr:alkaline phosphatase family protein [Chitinophagia bacterium]
MRKPFLPKVIRWTLLLGFCYLIIMSLLRYIFVNRFTAPLSSDNDLTASYFLGIRFDLRYVAIVMMITLLFSYIKPLNPFHTKLGRQIAIITWMLFSTLLLLFYTTDFIHYAYVHQRLNASILSYIDNPLISMQMMWQSYPIISIIIIFLVMEWIMYKFITYTLFLSNKYETAGSKMNMAITQIIFFIILLYSAIGNIIYEGGQYPLRWSDAYSLGSDYKANVALNPMQSFFSTLNFRSAKIDTDLIKKNYSVIAQYLAIPGNEQNAENLKFSRIQRPEDKHEEVNKIKNVVLVICESFSAYKSSMMGNPLNTTPYFNEMKKKGVYFNRAFSPAYGTARGVWAVLTGIPDILEGKTSSRNPLAVDQHTIISDFKNYEKYYFLGGSASWANIRGVLTNNISDLKIYEQGSYKVNEINVWGISDKDLFLEANKTLSKNKKPFFAIIQTADNHRPYTIPAEDLKIFVKKNVPKDSLLKYGFENNDEYNAFRYTDFCIEQFIEAAKKEKYFNETLFVFIGDHGIKGDAGSMLPKSFTEQGLTNMHIPFLFYAPFILQPKEYAIPVSQVDVMPSIASLCNIPYTNTTMGKNVFNTVQQNKNSIFLYDDFNQQIGVLNNEYYYGYQLKSPNKPIFESVLDNRIVKNDSAQKEMHILTKTIYETSKYMLIHNQKINIIK